MISCKGKQTPRKKRWYPALFAPSRLGVSLLRCPSVIRVYLCASVAQNPSLFGRFHIDSIDFTHFTNSWGGCLSPLSSPPLPPRAARSLGTSRNTNPKRQRGSALPFSKQETRREADAGPCAGPERDSPRWGMALRQLLDGLRYFAPGPEVPRDGPAAVLTKRGLAPSEHRSPRGEVTLARCLSPCCQTAAADTVDYFIIGPKSGFRQQEFWLSFPDYLGPMLCAGNAHSEAPLRCPSDSILSTQITTV